MHYLAAIWESLASKQRWLVYGPSVKLQQLASPLIASIPVKAMVESMSEDASQ